MLLRKYHIIFSELAFILAVTISYEGYFQPLYYLVLLILLASSAQTVWAFSTDDMFQLKLFQFKKITLAVIKGLILLYYFSLIQVEKVSLVFSRIFFFVVFFFISLILEDILQAKYSQQYVTKLNYQKQIDAQNLNIASENRA